MNSLFMISKKRKSGYIKPEITNFMIQNEGFICTSASVDGLKVGDYENGGEHDGGGNDI